MKVDDSTSDNSLIESRVWSFPLIYPWSKWPAHRLWTGSFVSVFVGLGMATFHIVMGRTSLGFLAISIFLMTFPVVYLTLTMSSIKAAERRLLLALMLLSSIFARYIFALTNPFIVGTDAPFHYFFAQEIASGRWVRSEHISGALPLLYWIYGSIAWLTNIPVHILATWIHPIINVATVYLFYVFFKALVPIRVAILAAHIYAWEYTSFFFGFEFRTQSLSIAWFAAFLALRSSIQYSDSMWRRILLAATSVLILIAISLTAFVSALLVSFLLAAMSVGDWIERRRTGSRSTNSTANASLLVFTATTFYLIYSSGAWEMFTPYVYNVVRSTITFDRVNDATLSSNLKGVYVSGYGSFVTTLQWAVRLIFLGGLAWQISRLARGTLNKNIGPLFATISILALVVIATPLGSVLSPGRYFQYLSPFYGLYVALPTMKLLGRLRRTRQKSLLCVLITFIFSMWSISGMLKLPRTLIDPTNAQGPVPSRIDRAMIREAQAFVRAFGATQPSICADFTWASALFMVAGTETFGPVSSPDDAVTCVNEVADTFPDTPVLVAVDTSLVDDPSAALSVYNFRLVSRTGSLVVLEQNP